MENERRVIGPPGLSLRTRENARARWRLEVALAFSLGFHAFLLFLQLGDAGFGLPGLELPWAERRVQATDIAARLVELPRAPAPTPLAVLPYVPPMPVVPELPKPPRAAKPVAPRPPRVVRAAPPEAPISLPTREAAEPAPVAEIPAPKPEVRPTPQPEILAQTEPQPETVNVPPPPAKPAEPEPSRKSEVESRKEEAAKQQAEAAARERAEEDARQRALALQKELEAKKQDDEKKQEEARRRAEIEKRKEEEAKRVALEAEALKRAEDAARQKELEAQRQAAEEAKRKEELARQQAEAAAKQQAEARRKAEEAARQQAAAPGAPSGRDIAAKALEGLRTPGAVQTPGVARVEPPRATALPGSVSGPRRRSVFGVERDVVMRSYVDSWRWKIERFGALNYRPSAAWRARDNPIVTVAIRKDGSLESVHINQSSGVRELDETVRRIAARYAPYSAFPPALALQYDVIEIRRVWFFDDTLKIMEEM